MNKVLKTIFINVNSLRSNRKRHALNDLIETEKPDIVLIAEHRLQSRINPSFKGYNFVKSKNQMPDHAGTAVCLKENFKYQLVDIKTRNLESTVITVETEDCYIIIDVQARII